MGDVPHTGESQWDDADVVSRFLTTRGHTDAGERAALTRVAEQARGDVLDIGVGGGRTTELLAPRARSYVGIDLSAQMLALARHQFPDADLREGDAAGLAELPDEAFDLVLFSFNGIDTLDHTARPVALAAMARVVRPEGRVLFSSLNLDGVSFDERPWRIAGGVMSPRFRYHVAEAVRHPMSAVRSVGNYRRTKAEAEDGQGWARRPLRAHEFRFVVHFTTMQQCIIDARAAGLEVVAAYADDGRTLSLTSAHTDADYVHFVCRRLPGD